MHVSPGRKKVLFLEFNEITWTILDGLIAEGKTPNFARIKREGTWASPLSNDLSPYLDPWITWVTVHAGVDHTVHGAEVLEPPAGTIKAKRTWEYARDAGRSLGLFGPISAYPPEPVNGFWIPGPFAVGSETYPQELEPVQQINRRYTRVHNRVEGRETPGSMIKSAWQLKKLGLRLSTVAQIARQLVSEKLDRSVSWRKVCLQPLINYDIFAALYKRHRPDYAIWHTNHVAHYQHHYWRAMDDKPFLTRASSEEKRRLGGAIEHGYRVADDLLGRFMRLIDDETVLVLASSMGQQPYVSERFPEGRITVCIRDINKLLDIVGIRDVAQAALIMAPQWNLTIHDSERRSAAKKLLETAYRSGPDPGLFNVVDQDGMLTVTPRGLSKVESGMKVFFPNAPGGAVDGIPFEDLFLAESETHKEGMHHPQGLLVFWGKGVRSGVEIRDTTNLDIAPTVLSLLDIPVPDHMHGRILHEPFSEASEFEASNKASQGLMSVNA